MENLGAVHPNAHCGGACFHRVPQGREGIQIHHGLRMEDYMRLPTMTVVVLSLSGFAVL